jgi:hypothetical protein
MLAEANLKKRLRRDSTSLPKRRLDAAALQSASRENKPTPTTRAQRADNAR